MEEMSFVRHSKLGIDGAWGTTLELLQSPFMMYPWGIVSIEDITSEA